MQEADITKPLWQLSMSELASLACEETTSPLVLEELAKSEDSYILLGVASNRRTPARVLAELALKGDYLINLELAGNPMTPAETLEDLELIDDVDILGALACNPKASDELRTKAAKREAWISEQLM